MERSQSNVELSLVMPCLDEERTLGTCIGKARLALEKLGVEAEIIVADNGSTDRSREIAERMGARVVPVALRGYGAALRGGLRAARGRYVIIGDADDSYDWSEIEPFLVALRAGHDLVMGNRFRGRIVPGAMPWLHRYLGNPVLSFVGRLFFGADCGDFHCGMRGVSRAAAERMDLQTTGMEFASEMVVKAVLLEMSIAEVPVTLHPDGRDRPPHLRSFRDGWRHLRFLLLFSPRWLFLYPGLALLLAGTTGMAWLLPGPRTVAGVTFDVHTLAYAASAVLVGVQAIVFAAVARVYATSAGLVPPDRRLERLYRYLSLEAGLGAGALLLAAGLGLTAAAMGFWGGRSFGDLAPTEVLRLVIPATLALSLGSEIVLSSFLLSFFGLSVRRRDDGQQTDPPAESPDTEQ